MSLARQIGIEITKALAVLALVFLAFAHTPVQSSGDGAPALTAYSDVSYCGQGPGDDGNGHGPCHACRAGIADLPAPPCVAEPAYTGFARVAFSAHDDAPLFAAAHSRASPRAPPASV